ncbi:hypothetical protein MRB53_038322 [Persea americana]|nr:hypothetical protein MRB53_038322 [Persea americana]
MFVNFSRVVRKTRIKKTVSVNIPILNVPFSHKAMIIILLLAHCIFSLLQPTFHRSTTVKSLPTELIAQSPHSSIAHRAWGLTNATNHKIRRLNDIS